jgi:hypothetical protein
MKRHPFLADEDNVARQFGEARAGVVTAPVVRPAPVMSAG